MQTVEKCPCEYLTYGSRCSLKFHLLEEKYEKVLESCPLKKKALLAGNDCYYAYGKDIFADEKQSTGA